MDAGPGGGSVGRTSGDEDIVRRYAVIVESRALGPYFTPVGLDGVSRRPTFRCNLNCRFAAGGTRAHVAVARRTPPGPLPPPRLRARSSPGALNPAKRPGLLARAVRLSSGTCALLAAGSDSDPRPGCPRHQNSGRCSGAPTGGKPSGQGVTLLRIANDLGDATTLASSSPSMPRGPAGQRSAPPPGGPDTTRTPAAPRKPAPHSTVAAGWPKLRATTAEKAPRSSRPVRCRLGPARRPPSTRSVQPSFLHGRLEEVGPFDTSVEQKAELHPGQPGCEDEAGKAAAATEVEDRTRPLELGPGGEEAESVGHVVGERSRTDSAARLRRGEHAEEILAGRPSDTGKVPRHSGKLPRPQPRDAADAGSASPPPVRLQLGAGGWPDHDVALGFDPF